MSKTSDYMDYLDREIGIAPANSQEEFRAAETIVEIMKDHGLEPTIQEFDTHPVGKMLPDILAVVMFVGMLLSGVGSTGLRLLGLLLALVPAILLLMRHVGRDVLANVGPAARSQNVIAVHRATGDKVTKGNRPIVVVAHYDTPRESPLFERLAPYQPRLARISVPCVAVGGVAALLQVFFFLPGALRLVLWIVGIVAMVPPLVLAVSVFVENASPCTEGANDNKSSVAALLGLLNQVRPQADRVGAYSDDGARVVEHSNEGATEADEPSAHEGETYGTRHGKDVLEGLGILPETCEIVYETAAPTAEADVDGERGANEANQPDRALMDEYVEPQEDESWDDEASAEGIPQDYDNPYYGNDTGAGTGDDKGFAPEYEAEESGEAADQLAEETYYDNPADGNQGWSEEGSWEDDSEAEGSQNKKPSVAGRVKTFFGSLRERFSKHGDTTDVSIPRGVASDGVDYSEFEETDWGDEDWGDSDYNPEVELKSINRDELIARRNAASEQDEAQPDDSALSEQGQDQTREPQGEVYSSEYDTYESGDAPLDAYDWDSGESNEATDDSYLEDEEPESGSDQADEEAASIESRTSHDISHENGPDWSIVEDDEEEVPAVEPARDADTSFYDQDDESHDGEYELNDTDLMEVEEELDEDQVASAPIRPRQTPDAQEVVGDSEDYVQIEASADSSDDGVGEEEAATTTPEDDGESELNWDSDDSQDDSDADDVLPKDSRGLDTISDEYDAYDGGDDENALDEPDPIDDPTWGETSYVPPRPKTSVARRATLYDVPSPSEETADPLADDDVDGESVAEGPASEHDDHANGAGDADESDANRARKWKGGAAIRSDLQGQDDPSQEAYDSKADVEAAADYAPDDYADSVGDIDGGQADQQDSDIDQDELQDAILRMGDDLLVSHDIWFVAAGASSVDHAGVKAFLSDFRQDIRGAFLINLDSVGAGEPTILTSEGLHEGRRSDRRLVRLISNVADDLHLPLAKRSHDWGDTDATPAMRFRVRAVTLTGLDQNGLPALSHTQDDVPENVDTRQVESVVRVIAEAIRRS